jgi:aspartyl-tRNA(Asn)/glutamyl-tRNA(Gln) amidotransferase subunit B
VLVHIVRAHLEEDSGKLLHVGGGGDSLVSSTHSLGDYNRAGTPLVEVVTAPDLRSGRDAAVYASELQRVVRFIGVSDGNMAEGSLRCDVNISVRLRGASSFGTKVEVKNLNSFSAIGRAVDYEIKRQVELIAAGRGDEVVQETRSWDESGQKTVSLRKKEGLADYRYFLEPDLLALALPQRVLTELEAAIPELPAAVRARYASLGLAPKDVLLLADSQDVIAYFDATVAAGGEARSAANWIMGDLTAFAKQEKMTSMAQLKLTPANLAQLLALIIDGTISGKIAKDLLPELLSSGDSPRDVVQRRGLVQISDAAAIEAIVDAVLAANPKQLADFRAGKDKLKGFFVGQIMKESGGKANPQLVEQVLMPRLTGK